MKKFFLIFIFNIFFINKSIALIEIDITRGNLDPLPIAVSPLYVDIKSENYDGIKVKELGEEISKIIESNFRSTGLFNPLKKEAFVQKPDIAHLKPRFEDWRLIKAQALITGSGPKNQRVKKLAIMDQDGANTKYLTLGNELVLTPRFNPTNQMVTYMSYFRNMPRVYLLDIETGTQEVVGNFPGMTFAPRFSPDGKKIVMSFAKDGNSDIYTMDLDSRVVERISDHSSIDTSPSFSPDGKFIAFNSDRSGLQQIYVMRSDGSGVKRITFGKGIYGTPVWSPRGDLIAFTKMRKGRFYIGVMRTDGTGERLLTENYYQEAPSWSPNGRVLVFYRETKAGPKGEGFSAKLWSIDITGYNERRLKTETDASDPSWSSLLSK